MSIDEAKQQQRQEEEREEKRSSASCGAEVMNASVRHSRLPRRLNDRGTIDRSRLVRGLNSTLPFFASSLAFFVFISLVSHSCVCDIAWWRSSVSNG